MSLVPSTNDCSEITRSGVSRISSTGALPETAHVAACSADASETPATSASAPAFDSSVNTSPTCCASDALTTIGKLSAPGNDADKESRTSRVQRYGRSAVRHPGRRSRAPIRRTRLVFRRPWQQSQRAAAARPERSLRLASPGCESRANAAPSARVFLLDGQANQALARRCRSHTSGGSKRPGARLGVQARPRLRSSACFRQMLPSAADSAHAQASPRPGGRRGQVVGQSRQCFGVAMAGERGLQAQLRADQALGRVDQFTFEPTEQCQRWLGLLTSQ